MMMRPIVFVIFFSLFTTGLTFGSVANDAKAQDPVESIQRILNAKGCPTTVTIEDGFPENLTVEVGDNYAMFESVGSAGSTAQDWCLADVQK